MCKSWYEVFLLTCVWCCKWWPYRSGLSCLKSIVQSSLFRSSCHVLFREKRLSPGISVLSVFLILSWTFIMLTEALRVLDFVEVSLSITWSDLGVTFVERPLTGRLVAVFNFFHWIIFVTVEWWISTCLEKASQPFWDWWAATVAFLGSLLILFGIVLAA